MASFKPRMVQFQSPTEILRLGSISQVASGQANILDEPAKRRVLFTPKDTSETMFTMVPYENIKSIRFVEEE